MSVANSALVYNLGLEAFLLTDDLLAPTAAARGSALRLPSQLNRITQTATAATGYAALPSLISGEAPWIIFVVNDSAQSIVVGAFGTVGGTNETISGVATTSNFSAGTVTIPSGQSAIFVPVPTGKNNGALDWRAAVIP